MKWIHNEANFRYVYANPDGYAAIDGGKKGGHLISAIHSTFLKLSKSRSLLENGTLTNIINEIRMKAKDSAGKVLMQNVQDVNNSNLRIKFEKRGT